MASNAASPDKLFIVLIITIICLCISSIYISTKLESKHHKEPPIQLRSFVAKGASKNSDVPVLISESHKQQAAATGDKRQQKQLQQQLQQQQQQTSSYPNGPKQDVKYKNDRVYCMVPFVYNKDFHTTIMQTWGRRCNVINFLTDSIVLKDQDTIKFRGDLVIGSDNNKRKKNKNDIDDMWKPCWEFPPDSFPDNVIFLNMTRSWSGCKDDKTGKPKICRHIWEKMWRSWVYVAEHHLYDAEWFCKVDYDTFFFPENLQYYVRDVKKWDPINEYYYFGQLLAKNNPPLIAGAAACWSQKTLRDVAQVYRDMPKGSSGGARPGICEDRAKAAEEVTTATCLKKHLNVDAEAMRDDTADDNILREYVMIDPVHNQLGWNRTEQGEWWYWANKPRNVGEMEDCCAVRPMAFHKYKKENDSRVLEDEFYGKSDNKMLKKLEQGSREQDKRMWRYVNKVRKAMDVEKFL